MKTFGDAEAVCAPLLSCVSMMREHYEMIAEAEDDTAFLADVRSLLPRIYEFSELLVDKLGVEDVGAEFAHRVAYHPRAIPCACCTWATGRRSCCAPCAG